METDIGDLALDKLLKINIEGLDEKGNTKMTLTFNVLTGVLTAGDGVFTTGGVDGCFSALQVRCPNSERCVSPYWICDGSTDCPDGADEIACDEKKPCKHGFTCWGSNQCLPRSWRCDGFEDCQDGEDELGCGNCGGDDLLRCGTGSDCVSVGYACDGQRQCPDGWDETDAVCNYITEKIETEDVLFNFQCPEGHLSCGLNGGCIDIMSVCNGVYDCLGGEDEMPMFCEMLKSRTLPKKNESTVGESAPSYAFTPQLVPGAGRVSAVLVDEIENYITTPPTSQNPSTLKTTKSFETVVPESVFVEEATKLDDPSTPYLHSSPTKEVRESSTITSTTTHRESTTARRVPRATTAQAFVPTTSSTTTTTTETTTTEKPTTYGSSLLFEHFPEISSQCRDDEFDCGDGWCVPLFWLCDGRFDCLNGEDEEDATCSARVQGIDKSIEVASHKDNAYSKTQTVSSCSDDQLRCSTGKCVERSRLCDGVNDCPEKEDEMACEILIVTSNKGGTLEKKKQIFDLNAVLPFDSHSHKEIHPVTFVEEDDTGDHSDSFPFTTSASSKYSTETSRSGLGDETFSLQTTHEFPFPSISSTENHRTENSVDTTESAFSPENNTLLSFSSTIETANITELRSRENDFLNKNGSYFNLEVDPTKHSENNVTSEYADRDFRRPNRFEKSSEKTETSNQDLRRNSRGYMNVSKPAIQFPKSLNETSISNDHDYNPNAVLELDWNTTEINHPEMELPSYDTLNSNWSFDGTLDYFDKELPSSEIPLEIFANISSSDDRRSNSSRDRNASDWLHYDERDPNSLNMEEEFTKSANITGMFKSTESKGKVDNLSDVLKGKSSRLYDKMNISVAHPSVEYNSTLLNFASSLNFTNDNSRRPSYGTIYKRQNSYQPHNFEMNERDSVSEVEYYETSFEDGEDTLHSTSTNGTPNYYLNNETTSESSLDSSESTVNNTSTTTTKDQQDDKNVTFTISGVTSDDGFLVLSTTSSGKENEGDSTILVAIHADAINGTVPKFIIHSEDGKRYQYQVVQIVNKPLRRSLGGDTNQKEAQDGFLLEKVITFRLENNGKLKFNQAFLNPDSEPNSASSSRKVAATENSPRNNVTCSNETDSTFTVAENTGESGYASTPLVTVRENDSHEQIIPTETKNSFDEYESISSPKTKTKIEDYETNTFYDYPDEWMAKEETLQTNPENKYPDDISNVLETNNGKNKNIVKKKGEKTESMIDNNIKVNPLRGKKKNTLFDLNYDMANDLTSREDFVDSNHIDPIPVEQINHDFMRTAKMSNAMIVHPSIVLIHLYLLLLNFFVL